jgi:hypothetical protein
MFEIIFVGFMVVLKNSIAPATYAVIGTGNRGGIRLQTYANTGIVPYDYPDLNTKYRMKKKRLLLELSLLVIIGLVLIRIYQPCDFIYLKMAIIFRLCFQV